MSKIWYCRNCGYEMTSRGRCHLCRQRLEASALPELPAGNEDDEVGYRLEGWTDRQRGRLIEELNSLEILHRFEDDELVVGADDEARVDDLIEELAVTPESDALGGDWFAAAGAEGQGEATAATSAAVSLLADAAERLRRDPTDMHADADVAEASAVVFMANRYAGADEETWAAIGRVTRRLLSALGADEALEDEIQTQAAVLEKLLTPMVGVAGHGDHNASTDSRGRNGLPDSSGSRGSGGFADSSRSRGPGGLADSSGSRGPGGLADSTDAGGRGDFSGPGDVSGPGDSTDSPESGGDEIVYELAEWLPEQRAQLSVLLDEASIRHEWDGVDLVVEASDEAEVEALFDRVGAPSEADGDDDGGESRYHALEELFAAADRLAGDPADEQRAAEAVLRIEEAAGPAPFGLDDVQWFRIMTQARTLSESIRSGQDEQAVGDEAAALRELLRAVV